MYFQKFFSFYQVWDLIIHKITIIAIMDNNKKGVIKDQARIDDIEEEVQDMLLRSKGFKESRIRGVKDSSENSLNLFIFIPFTRLLEDCNVVIENK